MSYPEVISMAPGTEEYERLKKHSTLFEELIEFVDEGENMELSADLLFGGNQKQWELFVDLFFPELNIHRVYVLDGKNLKIDPKRGTLDDVMGLFDYMMVDRPETMMNFAKNLARKSLNAPSATVPRGVGIRAAPGPRRNVLNTNNYFNANNYENEYENEHENEEENVNIGYTEEEEEMLGKLSAKNASKYYKGGKRVRKTHRSSKKRSVAKTRRHRK